MKAMTYTRYQELIAAYLESGSLSESPETIAAAAEGNIKKLVEIAGGNMSAFSRAYGIPLRTVQDWCSGRAKPGEYIPRLIGYTLIQA